MVKSAEDITTVKAEGNEDRFGAKSRLAEWTGRDERRGGSAQYFISPTDSAPDYGILKTL